ncbi:MAG: hypothetical protein KatS3mg111_1859 [Pirellulaceae bacterium]|nr:MAG: hypothetical protein KatS3mg111_1859 [Pirellulaceae bacterium]
MKTIPPYRRRSSTTFWLGGLFVFLTVAGGVVGLLVLLGVNLNPFADQREDPFMVRIPINSRPIPAYERVSREHLINPQTGGLMYQRLPPQSVIGMSITSITADGSHVEDRVQAVRSVDGEVVFVTTGGQEVPQSQTLELGGAIMNVNAIIGRVVKKDKRPGLGFQEDNFFPRGTPEGIAGATPPGMRAVVLDATKLTGAHALNAGDKIDLIASVPVEKLSLFQSQYTSRLPGAALVTSASSRPAEAATEPMLLAQNAVVLKPVYVRNEATTSSSLTQGKRVQNVPKYEVAIAVAPDDVIPLQSALNQELTITCVAHSMQPTTAEPTAAESVPSELTAPVTVRPILAYEVVTREAFVNPATRRIRMEPISRQQAERLGIVRSLQDALGAVARHDIPAGSFIRYADLLNGSLSEAPPSSPSAENRAAADRDAPFRFVSQPREPPVMISQSNSSPLEGASVVGDRPAITEFLPPGRFAVAVPWKLLYGAEHLQIEDHVDLLATYPLERKQSVNRTATRGDNTVVNSEYEDFVLRATDRTRSESLGARGEPWLVATDAIVVGPVGYPAPAAALRAIGAEQNSAGTDTPQSGPAILLAVDSRDVESLATALNTAEVQFSVAFRPRTAAAMPPGFKRIAVAPVELAAFELFSDLNWKGLRREITTRLVREDDVNFQDAISASEIANYYGRVLKTRKLRFQSFTPDDFLPPGAAPGAAAGIHGQNLAVMVSTDQIAGLGRFSDNDRIAIVLAGAPQLPPNAVLRGSKTLGPDAEVVVQSARVVRSASDTSDTVTLEVHVDDATKLCAALVSPDTTSADGGRHQRLIAIARPRAEPLTNPRTVPAEPVIASRLSVKHAPRIEAMVGRRVETHIFSTDFSADGEQ